MAWLRTDDLNTVLQTERYGDRWLKLVKEKLAKMLAIMLAKMLKNNK